MLRSFWIIASCTALLFTASCKSDEQDDGNIKTLDNFAKGTTDTVYSCSADQPVDVRWKNTIDADYSAANIKIDKRLIGDMDADTQKAYYAAVDQYLTSLPADLQDAFLSFRGEIMLTHEADSICGALFNDNQSDQYVAPDRRGYASCVVYDHATPDQGLGSRAVLALIHKIDPKLSVEENIARIKHGGVRSIGMSFTQFFAQLSPENDSAKLEKGLNFKVEKSAPAAIAEAKRKIANGFLVDMVRAKDATGEKKYDLKVLEPLLGQGSATLIEAVVKDSGEVSTDLLGIAGLFKYEGESNVSTSKRDVRRARFEDFVFGEAFDSYNCSDASRAVMASDFATAKTAYSSAVSAVAAHAKLLADHAEKHEVLDSSSIAEQPAIALSLTTQQFQGTCAQCQGCGCNCNCSAGGGCSCCNGCNCNPGGGGNKPAFAPSQPSQPAAADPFGSGGFLSQNSGGMALLPLLSKFF